DLGFLGGTGTDNVNMLASLTRVNNVAMSLGNGTNTVAVDSLQATTFSLNTGTGGDTVQLDNVTITSNTSLQLGNGDNQAFLASTVSSLTPSRIGGTLRLTTGSGADTVRLGQNAALRVAGVSNIVTGGATGDAGDSVFIDNSLFAFNLTIQTGAGNDDVRLDATVTTGDLPLAVGAKLTGNVGA